MEHLYNLYKFEAAGQTSRSPVGNRSAESEAICRPSFGALISLAQAARRAGCLTAGAIRRR